MNYDKPRQVDPKSGRADAGKWRFTTMNDGRVREIGYCSPYRPCPECKGAAAISGVVPGAADACSTCDGYGFVEGEHCPGHDTELGAREHYTQYQLDHELRLDGGTLDAKYRCVFGGCDEWTQSLALVGSYGPSWHLCDTHRTRDVVAALYGLAGDSTHT